MMKLLRSALLVNRVAAVQETIDQGTYTGMSHGYVKNVLLRTEKVVTRVAVVAVRIQTILTPILMLRPKRE